MKLTKGCYGYLNRQKKVETVKTVLFFALPVAIFLMGYLSTGTRANLLTIVAVVGCLPACKSTVSLVMYWRAGTCSKACHEAISSCGASPEGPVLLYDLYLTSYRKNFQVSAMAIKNNVVCGLSEDGKCDLGAGEAHIGEILGLNGYAGVSIKLFSDAVKFQERVSQMCKMAEKNRTKDEGIAQIVLDISL